MDRRDDKGAGARRKKEPGRAVPEKGNWAGQSRAVPDPGAGGCGLRLPRGCGGAGSLPGRTAFSRAGRGDGCSRREWPRKGRRREGAAGQEGGGTETGAELQDTLTFAEKSYEEIYEILEPHWSGTQIWNTGAQYAGDEAAALPEAAAEESQAALSEDSSAKAFGQTNVQTEGVDEADTLKNDGRYLYQLAEYLAEEEEKETGAARWGIQIVDTKGGLRESSFVGRFEYPREFYVWEDLLIVLEDGYYTADYVQGADASVEENEEAGAQESSESSSIMVCGDVLYAYNQYTKIHIYDISDRESPRLRKSFTLDGAYRTSRLAEGYFYGFTFFTPKPGSGEEDYEAYIPQAGGSLLPAEKIACPDGQGAEQYLVMVSIDLGRPEELLDSRPCWPLTEPFM